MFNLSLVIKIFWTLVIILVVDGNFLKYFKEQEEKGVFTPHTWVENTQVIVFLAALVGCIITGLIIIWFF